MFSVLYDDVQPPADAVDVDEWMDECGDGRAVRHFEGTSRGDRDLGAVIRGVQNSDGSIAKRVILVHADNELGATDARKLASYVRDAADELDRLAKAHGR